MHIPLAGKENTSSIREYFFSRTQLIYKEKIVSKNAENFPHLI